MAEKDTSEAHGTPLELRDLEHAPVKSADQLPATTSIDPPTATDDDGRYIKGARLHLTTIGLCLCLFLTNIEIPIVNTSLPGIVNDLHGFDQSSWVIAAYLITYVGFLIIWAKLSDIFGRKLTTSIAVGLFVVFSGACGAAQTMFQLIMLRAMQGFGASGLYALCMVIFFELVPPSKFAAYSGLVASVFALSLLFGPIWGGAIVKSSTWRWVFLFNVPAGAIGLALIILCLPKDFPYHGQPVQDEERRGTLRQTLKRIDSLGTLGLLAGTVLLVTAVEEAAVGHPWGSTQVAALLAIAIVSWILFLAWEWYVTKQDSIREPVFPWRFLQNRVWLGLLTCAFFLGGPFTVAIFSIPQRFVVVNGVSTLSSGLRLIPFTFSAPIASLVAAAITSNKKFPPIYLCILSSILQTIGLGLLAYLPLDTHISNAQYGYQVIAGFGAGINISLLQVLTPFSVEPRDKSVAIGAVSQFRVMGAAVGVSIVTCVLNSHVRSALSPLMSSEQLHAIMENPRSAAQLPAAIAEATRLAFAEGYNLQMRVLMGFAIAQLPAALLMWQKEQIRV